MACEQGNEKNGEPDQSEAERRRHERRQRDEPVLLDTRAPGERRRSGRRKAEEPVGVQEGEKDGGE